MVAFLRQRAGLDVPYDLVIDHHGGVIVAGTSEHAGGYDAAIVKWGAGCGLSGSA